MVIELSQPNLETLGFQLRESKDDTCNISWNTCGGGISIHIFNYLYCSYLFSIYMYTEIIVKPYASIMH